MSSSYSFENYMSDSFKYLDKIHQHPFLWKYSTNHIYYPNPEYLNTYIPEIPDNTQVYAILFTVETKTVYPFVKFAMTSKGPPSFYASGDENEFIIECNKAVLNSFVKPNGTISDFFDIAFRGFITLSNTIFVFYDISPLLQQGFTLDNKFRFMLSSEVCESPNKGLQLLNKQTDYPKCVLFQPVYAYNMGSLVEEIPLPVVAYCKNSTPELTDLDEDKGLYYVFTERYIDTPNNPHNRFALFLMNHKPWFSNIDGVNTFTFVKNGVLHFAVKSPDQFIAI